MKPTRMVTIADRRSIARIHTEYDRGYNDATTGRDPNSTGVDYERGWVAGKSQMVDWAIEDLKAAKEKFKL